MGDILKSIVVGGVPRQIKPLERNLENGETWYTLDEVCDLPGGIIIGEGDTGKTTYVKLLESAAAKRGPTVLIPLRHRPTEFQAPKPQEGEIATLILDGLDEYPECTNDILDLVSTIDTNKCHIWITSRPGDAASCLRCHGLFVKPYRLSDFLTADAEALAKSISIDPTLFIRTVRNANLESFLAKPGGAILMLNLFAKGILHDQTRLQIMDTIAAQFIRESRDGHTKRPDADPDDPKKLLDAAKWIAAYLMLSGYRSVWCGDEADRPADAAPFHDIPNQNNPYDLLTRVIGRRIFEPLDADHLRFSYSDTLEYLAGSWISENLSLKQIQSFIPTDGAKVNITTARTLSWAGIRRPELCLPWIEAKPEMFLSCHDAIHQFGCKRYFKEIVRLCSDKEYDFFNELYCWHDHLAELDGYEELADFARSTLERMTSTQEEATAAAYVLTAYHTNRTQSAAAIVKRLLADGLDSDSQSWMCDSLRSVCGELRPPFLEGLKRLLKVDVKSASEESTKGNLLYLLWPEFLTEDELKAVLNPPIDDLHINDYRMFLEITLKKDYGLEWLKRIQERGKDRLIKAPPPKSLWPRKLPEGFLADFRAAIKSNNPHVWTLLQQAEKEDLGLPLSIALGDVDLSEHIQILFFITRQKPDAREILNTVTSLREGVDCRIPLPPSDDIMHLFWEEAKGNKDDNLRFLIGQLENSYYENKNTIRLTPEQINKLESEAGNPILRQLDKIEQNADKRHEVTRSAIEEINKNLVNHTLNFNWKRCKQHSPRFLCDKNFENIKDEKHTGHLDYPKIDTYLNLPEKARIAIRELLDAAKNKSPDKWWTKSVFKDKEFKGQSYSEAFGPKLETAHRFKRDQIETGTNKSHKGDWRIVPDQDFLDNYRRRYPKEDATSGS